MSGDIFFRNRPEAGKKLAGLLTKYKDGEVVIYALPRGGVPVAKEIARELHGPLDLLLIRKIGHPFNPEYALGAVSEAGRLFVNERELEFVDQKWLAAAVETQKREAQRRRQVYLKNKAPVDPRGKIAIIVDDGMATGSTMLVAIRELRQKGPAKIVVAVPVSPQEAAELIQQEADEFVSPLVPEYFLGAIGAYYEDFAQVSDEEVIALLEDPA